MENIIDKLTKLEDTQSSWAWGNWSLEEKKQILDLYLIISKKETLIFKLIYNYHGCDGWENIFRDYNIDYLEEKQIGVENAINEIIEQIESAK